MMIKGILLSLTLVKHFQAIKKFGNLGANGVKGSKFPVENVIF